MSHLAVVAPALPSHFRALEALAGELVVRGHRVTFIHQQDAANWLSDPRIGFHGLGLHSHPPGSLRRTLRIASSPGGPLGLRRLIADMSRSTDMLCRELPVALDDLRVDALLCDQMEAAGGLVAEATGLPYVSVACALPINREPGLPLPVMPMKFACGERAEKMYAGSARVYDWLMQQHGRTVARHAKAFGLPPRQGLHECLSPYAQISQTPMGFDFPRHGLPPNFHGVGPLRPARQAAQHLDFEIDPHRPLVFASLGTLLSNRFGLFRRIVRACRGLGVQLLLAHCGGLTPAQARALQHEGATWVTDFAPQLAVLARADALVSHGGLNTVLDALATHTPILALPLAFDQPGVAARVVHAGVGLQASAAFASSRKLRKGLEQLLTDCRFTAPLEQRGAEIRAARGTAAGADIIEKIVPGVPPAAVNAP